MHFVLLENQKFTGFDVWSSQSTQRRKETYLLFNSTSRHVTFWKMPRLALLWCIKDAPVFLRINAGWFYYSLKCFVSRADVFSCCWIRPAIPVSVKSPNKCPPRIPRRAGMQTVNSFALTIVGLPRYQNTLSDWQRLADEKNQSSLTSCAPH